MKKRHPTKGHHIAHAVTHLGMPHHRGHLTAPQKNAMAQHQILAAQQAMQDRINHMQRMSYTGNPHIR